tara:strand:- start:63 stop:614 length:552 start_codon:yes stop_codon:yes gene_type:complete
MIEIPNRDDIYNLLIKVGGTANSRTFSENVSWIPYLGRPFRNQSRKNKIQRTLNTINHLEQAFELGYVPGGIAGEPEEWTNTTHIAAIDLRVHPDNEAYHKELAEIIRSRIDAKTNLHPVKTSGEGYNTFMTTEALLDLIDPKQMKHQKRRLEYGNTDKDYWLSWANEMKDYIKAFQPQPPTP